MSEETPEQTEGPRPGYVIVGPDGHAVPEEATDGTDDGAVDCRPDGAMTVPPTLQL